MELKLGARTASKIWLLAGLQVFSGWAVRSEEFGDFTYEVVADAIEITGYNTLDTGNLQVPAEIAGLPVTRIGNSAFSGCRLRTITLADSVTWIGDSAFTYCEELVGIVLSENLTHIGDTAFRSCLSLATISLPSTITSIGASAFEVCPMLRSIAVSADNPAYASIEGVLFQTAPMALVRYPEAKLGSAYSIPPDVSEIAPWAFYACEQLAVIDLPPGLSSIGAHAFDRCRSLQSAMLPAGITRIEQDTFKSCLSLAEVTIPEGVRSIGFGAFGVCLALREITIPASVTEFSYQALISCPSLESINVAVGNANFSSIDGVLFDASGLELVEYPENRASRAYQLPPGATAVRESAFNGARNLETLSVPASLASIGDYALNDCLRLVSIEVHPENPHFQDIGGVLYDSAGATLRRYPPALPHSTFAIPPAVSQLGLGAFQTAIHLKEMEFPETLSSLGEYAFRDCTGLTRVQLPPMLSVIGAGSFWGCSQLATITVPAGVTLIDRFAFYRTPELSRVLFLGDAPEVEPFNFSSAPRTFTIYYLQGAAGFQGASWIRFFWNLVAIHPAREPASIWLIQHNLDHDASLDQTLPGSGINLLTAYALDLDPRPHAGAQMPAPEFDQDSLSLTFHASSPGIRYQVQASTDLVTWTGDGVALSGLSPDGRRTATVTTDQGRRMLRLVFEEQ